MGNYHRNDLVTFLFDVFGEMQTSKVERFESDTCFLLILD